VNLSKLVEDAERLSESITFEEEASSYNFSKRPEVLKWWREDTYYRALAACCRILKVDSSLEVGTMYGGSALALAKGSRQAYTCDIDLTNVVDPFILQSTQVVDDFCPLALKKEPGVHGVKLNSNTACVSLPFKDFQFIFIDIGVHEGDLEEKIHQKLVNSYCGVAAFDDINWGGMVKFWESVTQPKLATNWHADSGFGLVYYEGKDASE
jgi:predicted O-methyltransferase YrrM